MGLAGIVIARCSMQEVEKIEKSKHEENLIKGVPLMDINRYDIEIK